MNGASGTVPQSGPSPQAIPSQPPPPSAEEEMAFYSELLARRHLDDFNALRLVTEASSIVGAVPKKQAEGLLKLMERERRRLGRELRPRPEPPSTSTGKSDTNS
jgi:hypothetical protein